ncbi:uroplakin-2 [Hyperolius riggenbachi]|uniref:uroplakin-2 n=1 Tax=Hyperolius riggenbachi TaxID=752182 RepID=UPI0035A2DAAF
MQLLGLAVLSLLLSTSWCENTSLYSSSSIVANPFATSVIVALPSGCQYANNTAFLSISNSSGFSLNQSFSVPQCRLKRDLIVINNAQSGNVETVNMGYQITGLNPGSTYTVQYTIGGVAFASSSVTTMSVQPSPPVTFARSGGMVVITVLLSISMFFLVIGLIVVLVLGGRGKK